MRATKAIIHLENLVSNIQEIKKIVGKDTKICCPVKANAYGHGAVEVAKCALKNGVYCLAVATVDEGVELRKAGISCPILLFSLSCSEDLGNLISYELTPFVFDEEYIKALQTMACRLGRKLKVFLKIDSGMGRIGCKIEDAQKIAKIIHDYPNLELVGCATHLCVSDCVDEDSVLFTEKQIADFSWAVDSIRAARIDPGLVTCAASGAVLQYIDKAKFDMVRPGILFYGYYPDECVKNALIEKNGFAPEFLPVMEFKSKVEAIKKVSKGTSISYGRTWFAPKDTYIATIPVGYADGLFRHFAGELSLQINGKMYPIVGRICMDQCMVDLGSETSVQVWDDVTIFGLSENDNTAETLANIAGTIPYEITCSISGRVPRKFVEE